jgi:two-component system chemotaxis response regulator CheB
MVSLFQQRCRLPVREAEDKVRAEGGVIYFAPPDYHVMVEADHRLSLSSEEPVNYSRPSIDVLFESAADAYGAEVIGVILSGANHDGAAGLHAVEAAGGATLVQRPDQSPSPQMPLAALQACAAAESLSLSEIAARLREASR